MHGQNHIKFVFYFIKIVGCNVIVMVLMLIIADYSRWISSQDVSVLLVCPSFPFLWVSGGCEFLGCVFSRVLSLRLSRFSGPGGC